MEINWEASAEDYDLIDQIVNRADRLGLVRDRTESTMDITAAHLNGCPLRLADMLAADDFNFIHDVGGIGRHIDTKTGKLQNCFLPRFAVPVTIDAE